LSIEIFDVIPQCGAGFLPAILINKNPISWMSMLYQLCVNDRLVISAML